MQAEGKSSDCVLKPVALLSRCEPQGCYIVLSEVMHADGTPALHQLPRHHRERPDLWIGLEQEYFLYKDGRPLGFRKAATQASRRP